jgi:hypothetical protein
MPPNTALTIDGVREAVLGAGLEIYRVTASEVVIAQRVRMHLMDSGVSVAISDGPRVSLTVRSQRSDFPDSASEDLFERVRQAVDPSARPRGFLEVATATRAVTDPVDEENVLDVWHELTFAKRVDALEAMIDEVRWALELPKCVEP